jgi:hypothetical protein
MDYHEKHFVVKARNKVEAQDKAIAMAEKEAMGIEDPKDWKYLGQDFEVFAPITEDE